MAKSQSLRVLSRLALSLGAHQVSAEALGSRPHEVLAKARVVDLDGQGRIRPGPSFAPVPGQDASPPLGHLRQGRQSYAQPHRNIMML